MDNELENTIKELDEYIASGRSRLGTILTALDWTIEDTLKESTCGTNNRTKESVDRNDPLLPDSFDCKNSVVIEKTQLQKILNKNYVSIPTKFSDIQLNFTREQKSKIYDYVIAHTAKTTEPELKVSYPNDDTDNTMTFAEIVAKAKKKEKKLQRKYRTSKPTHIEEVRNLVHLQMQALEKYFNLHSDTSSPSPSYKDRRKNSEKCRNERSRSVDDNIQNKSSESRYKATGHHDSRRSDKREETMKRRRNRSSNRMSLKSVQRTKHSKDKRSGDRNETLVDRSKIRLKRNKSQKAEKKHKAHRNQ